MTDNMLLTKLHRSSATYTGYWWLFESVKTMVLTYHATNGSGQSYI